MSEREKRYGKAPPAVPGVKSGSDMTRAAFSYGRAKRKAQFAPEPDAPAPLPDWMRDPAKLPKRPPGKPS